MLPRTAGPHDARVLKLQVQSAAIGVFVVAALVAAVLLRRRRQRIDGLFSVFGGVLMSWYLAGFLRGYLESDSWRRLELGLAALMPATLIRLFVEIMPLPAKQSRRVAASVYPLSALLAIAAFSPLGRLDWLQLTVAGYVLLAMLAAARLMLPRPEGRPRVEFMRRRYLVIGALVVTALAVASDMPFSGPEATTVSHFLLMLYAFFLSQVILRDRLIDLNEFLARMLILSVLAAAFGSLSALLVGLGESTSTRLFGSVVAVIILLTLYEPLKAWVEGRAMALIFGERRRFLHRLEGLRRQMQHGVIDPAKMAEIVAEELHDSRRVTHVGVFLVEPAGSAFVLQASAGPLLADRIDAKLHPALWQVLQAKKSAVLGAKLSQEPLSPDLEEALSALGADVLLPLSSGTRVLGFLSLGDDRSPEPYSTVELAQLLTIADTAATVVWNSRLADRLRERDRLAAIGSMAAGLAHEIRNPLGAIKGAAELLDPEELSRPEDREVLTIIVDETERLNAVVSQFLDYARPFRMSPRSTDLNTVVKKTAALLAKQVTPIAPPQLLLAEPLPELKADPEQLRQVIINLILNGQQASQPSDPPLQLSTRALPARGLVELRVRDFGAGVAAEDLERIFLPFFTTKQAGTGLGLAVCQRIVHQHGGSIFAEPRVRRGTEFVVQLPIPKPETSPLPAPQ